VPSKYAEMHGGGKLPEVIEIWYPAKNKETRTETGIVHKELLT
jgi:hypothetical protein